MDASTRRPASRRLLVFDSVDSSRVRLVSYLRGHGFDIVETASSREADSLLAAHGFDAWILGSAVPGGPDWSALERWIQRGRPPALVITPPGDPADRILALEAGAADSLSDPCSLRELVARTWSVLRRSARASVPHEVRARFADWTVDLDLRHAESPTRHVELTAGETSVLAALIRPPYRVRSRHALLASTGHDEADVFVRTIDVLVSRLRHKLEADPVHPTIIQTVRGEGYCFACDVCWLDA